MNYLIAALILLGIASCRDEADRSSQMMRPSPTGIANEAVRKPSHVSPGPTGQLLDAYFSRLAGLGRFNGVALLRSGDTLLVHQAYNMPTDPGLTTLSVTTESRFDLRSVAKLFAKVRVLELEEQGLLRRSNPLSRFLPDFPRGDEITIGHLLEHRSGLPREFDRESILDLKPGEIVELARLQPLEFEPGSRQQYSNVGFQLLYYLIGIQTGSTFEEDLERTYFTPMGMEGTGSHFVPKQRLPGRYAHGHFEREGRLQSVTGFLPDEARMGNLYSTAADMDRFLHALDSAEVAPLLEAGRLSHAGGTRGKRAYVERDFGRKYSIVFLANYDGIPFEQVVRDLRTLLQGGEVALPKEIHRTPVELPASVLRRYEGTYDFAEAGHLILELRLERDTLWVYQKGKNNGPLFPESDTVFFGDPQSAESLEFVREPGGGYHALMDFQGVQWKGERVE